MPHERTLRTLRQAKRACPKKTNAVRLRFSSVSQSDRAATTACQRPATDTHVLPVPEAGRLRPGCPRGRITVSALFLACGGTRARTRCTPAAPPRSLVSVGSRRRELSGLLPLGHHPHRGALPACSGANIILSQGPAHKHLVGLELQHRNLWGGGGNIQSTTCEAPRTGKFTETESRTAGARG